MKFVRYITASIIGICLVGGFAVSVSRDAVTASKNEYSINLPVLMYHQVLDKPSKLGKYVISPQELEADLMLLDSLGYETVTVRDLIDFCDGKRNLPPKPVMLTFDDGYQTDYINVFPLLRRYNMKAVFSVVGSYTEKYSQENIDKHINYAHLSWDEIREMYASGHCEFQNHSYNMHSLEKRHGCLKINGESDEHYRAMMLEDIQISQKLFAEELGFVPECFTYPYGGTCDTLKEIIKEETFFASLGTYEQVNVLTGKRDELYDIRRFNRAHGADIRKILKKAEK
ncbi:MAG: polysaccharide deacetylase family protein [Oscillospiraceae bacterium]|nr:polysaccharide deacetylase family protein [Oscillospiraceae bacterium]MBQ4544311.1 polysaccharide deacetylase family protein [Oscillospiraceae bacterium]MBQ6902290.1 polysaccharide deacetylase family protein [Oscillospiraceae bacterium]